MPKSGEIATPLMNRHLSRWLVKLLFVLGSAVFLLNALIWLTSHLREFSIMWWYWTSNSVETRWVGFTNGRYNFSFSRHDGVRPTPKDLREPRLKIRFERMPPAPVMPSRWTYRIRSDAQGYELLGLQLKKSQTRVSTSRGFNLPCSWVAAVSLSIILATLLRRVRQSGLGRLCAHCGYDLRASIGRCPECGASIPLPPSLISTTLQRLWKPACVTATLR